MLGSSAISVSTAAGAVDTQSLYKSEFYLVGILDEDGVPSGWFCVHGNATRTRDGESQN